MKKLLYIGNKLSCHGFTITTIESLGLLLENEGYTLHYASSKRNKLLRLFDMLWTTAARSSKTDFVIIDTYATQNFWYALLVSQLCRLLNLKYIPILHGGSLPERLRRNPKFCRMLFAHSHINVAPSNYFFSIFTEAGYDNTVAIPNIIETQHYEYMSRKRLRPRLLWVRSMAQIYNPAMAIEVLASLKNEFPNAALCMVGPDKEHLLDGLRTLAQQRDVTVEFTGRLTKAEWIRRSREFDIFINTTTLDNTPVSVIEAMALGLPVVSTNVAGLPYLLDDRETALLVNNGSVPEMVSAIKLLISDPELAREISEKAYRVALGFDWQVVKHKWRHILN